MGTTSNSTDCCDKCGRNLDGKGYIMISGWKICGICQFEQQAEKGQYLDTLDYIHETE